MRYNKFIYRLFYRLGTRLVLPLSEKGAANEASQSGLARSDHCQISGSGRNWGGHTTHIFPVDKSQDFFIDY